MKTYLKYILAPTALAITLTGCFDLASPGSDTDESINATVTTAMARESQNSGSCKFEGRATTKTLQDARGVITKIMVDQNTRQVVYGIHMPSTHARYSACDLPAEMQKEGAEVIFSGDVKEIFPHERWMATPFEMRSIRMQ